MDSDNRGVRAIVPASTANLGPGFDTLGMALPLYLTVELAWQDTANNYPTSNNGLIDSIIKQVWQEAGIDLPYFCLVNSQIPLARGLGSSAAAILAAILAANELGNLRMTREQILERAVAIEGHADNVVPALVGGFTTAMVTPQGIYYQQITPPSGMKLLMAVPDNELTTNGSRQVLPNQVPLSNAVYNLQRACYLVAAFANQDIQGLKEAFQDCWHQPFRASLVPGLKELIAGLMPYPEVLGVTLSGSGPSILILVSDKQEQIKQQMETVLGQSGWQGTVYDWLPCSQGARIERRSNGIWVS